MLRLEVVELKCRLAARVPAEDAYAAGLRDQRALDLPAVLDHPFGSASDTAKATPPFEHVFHLPMGGTDQHRATSPRRQRRPCRTSLGNRPRDQAMRGQGTTDDSRRSIDLGGDLTNRRSGVHQPGEHRRINPWLSTEPLSAVRSQPMPLEPVAHR